MRWIQPAATSTILILLLPLMYTNQITSTRRCAQTLAVAYFVIGLLFTVLPNRDLVAQSDETSIRHDYGSWLTTSFGGRLGADSSPFSWAAMGQLRLLESSAGYHVGVGGVALGYGLSNSTTVRLGAALFNFDPSNADNVLERRFSQELIWSAPVSDMNFTFHGRLEERFFSSGDDMGLRLRGLFRLRAPVTDDGRLGAEGYQEFWISLRDTDWGARSGYSQNRVYLGGYYRLNEMGSATLSVGYLNQVIFTQVRDFMRHLLSLQMSFRI